MISFLLFKMLKILGHVNDDYNDDNVVNSNYSEHLFVSDHILILPQTVPYLNSTTIQRGRYRF